jgi:RNA polymerase sigma-70 factor (family 1)
MEPTDSQLTCRLKQHDEAAFETLFRRHYRYLYTVAIQYVKDPNLAEDALQDVYLKVWLNREQLDETQSIKAYLATAMRHQVLNRLRNDKRAILHHLEHQAMLPDFDTATEESITLSEYGSVVRQGLLLLPAQRRLVFTLRSEMGLTNEEVAKQLRISINTVKAQYYQACRFLRDYLRQHADLPTLLALIILSNYH